MSSKTQYSGGVIAGMQMLYGEGFLSPGGATEVGQLLTGLDPSGMRVLDIGCGLGGCSIMLVRDFDAKHVTGIDIEQELTERATAAVDAAALTDQITIQKVDPGRFPFEDQNFDLVVTKDVICHVPDKHAIMAEIFRVLKTGGSYLCADFLDASDDEETSSEGRTYFQSYVDEMKAYGLSFHFESQSTYENSLESAGFSLKDLRDHTTESVAVALKEKTFLASDQSGLLAEVLGEDRFLSRLNASTLRLEALKARGLLHVHFNARKP